MEWVLILALGAWVWRQSTRISALTERVRLLEAEAPIFAAAPEPPVEEAEPLVLDTPLPEPSNDRDETDDEPALEAEAPKAPPLPALEEGALSLAREEPAEEAPQPPPAWTEPGAPRRGFDQWLAENGLAWIGGGLFALGAAFLVAFAAQSGFFTPGRRLIAAIVLGVLLIAAGEWVRRAARTGPGHPLAAALLAGAGVATFYIAAWAAHGLYHFIDWPLAAGLFTACALVLLALSQWHGQPLGVLGVACAMLAPALAGAQVWPPQGLTTFLCAVGGSGLLLAALRRWAWTAGAALLGLYVWFADAIALDQITRALTLLTTASLGAGIAALRLARVEEPPAVLGWRGAQAIMPTAVICISSVLLVWTWLSIAPLAGASPAGPALTAIFHVGLAALAVRMRGALAMAFAVSVGALVLGLTVFMRARAYYAPGAAELYHWPLITAAAVGLAGLGARTQRHGRIVVAAAGAAGAALLVVLAAFSRQLWSSPPVWAALFVGAALLVAAAHIVSRAAAKPQSDWAVDLWVGAGAVLALIGMESLAPAIVRPAAQAAVSLVFALLFAARGWRGASWAALAAAALALTHAIAPDFTGAVLSGTLPIARALLFLAAAAAFLFGAAEIAGRRARPSAAGDALSSAAILVILLGLFLGLRWLAAGGAGASLDAFTENALRGLMLIAAGYIVTPVREGPIGRIAAARGHVLMGAGLLTALFSAALLLNPWWGSEPASIIGPPILNAQMLAFAAPGALASIAAARLYSRNASAARIYAGVGGLLGALWIVMETRRGFHGADMGAAEIGLLEGCVYGLEALLVALAICIGARIRMAHKPERPFTIDLARTMRALAMAGVALGVLFLLVLRHPWWGGQDPLLSDTLETGLAVLAQGAAAGLSLALGRALSQSRGVDGARYTAAAAAALFALSFGHGAIRWVSQFGAMDNQPPLYGLEGLAHALWPLAFVLTASGVTQRAPGRDTVRAYLYDLQALWCVAIWPALAFAAFGVWFLFNPWWGVYPARAETMAQAVLGLAIVLAAAWLSLRTPHVPHVRMKPLFQRAATIACAGHLFVALSLSIRRAFHGAEMTANVAGSSAETWSYSIAWALFGAGLVGLGTQRRDATLRWSGLGLLMFVIAKVLLFDTATLSGVIRAASVIGVAVILVIVTLAVRRHGAQGSRQ